MATQTSGLGFVGQSVTRVEDDRFLTGTGQFVADVQPEGGLHAAFVRSPFPHATITGVDTSEAKRLAGVVAVYTGAELNEGAHPFVPLASSPGGYSPLYRPMADGKVRHIGDPVALVVAESRHVAEDAAELVVVDYDMLDGVGSIDKALASGAPQLLFASLLNATAVGDAWSPGTLPSNETGSVYSEGRPGPAWGEAAYAVPGGRPSGSWAAPPAPSAAPTPPQPPAPPSATTAHDDSFLGWSDWGDLVRVLVH